jgi:hypothetical protein
VTVRGGFGGGEQATLLALLVQKYKYSHLTVRGGFGGVEQATAMPSVYLLY